MNRKTMFVAVGSVFFGLVCGLLARQLGYEYLTVGVSLLATCAFAIIGGIISSKMK